MGSAVWQGKGRGGATGRRAASSATTVGEYPKGGRKPERAGPLSSTFRTSPLAPWVTGPLRPPQARLALRHPAGLRKLADDMSLVDECRGRRA